MGISLKKAEPDKSMDLAEKLSSIKRAWLDFIENDVEPSPNVIRREIYESWVRSKKHNLVSGEITLLKIAPKMLAEKKQASKELIDATSPLFTSLNDAGNDPSLRLDIYDHDLYFVKTFGSVTKTVEARKEYALPGVLKSESICGTTAMCIAKRTKKPIQMMGAEHYNIASHGYTCTSIPILSPNDTLLGVINMVEECSTDAAKRLDIMVAFGKGVEYNILQMRKQAELEVSYKYFETIIREIEDAIVAVGKRGTIMMANKAALDLFGRTDLVGSTTEELLGSNNYFNYVLQSGFSVLNKELVIHVFGAAKRQIASFRPIFSGDSSVYGVIGVFRDMNQTRKILKHFGWNASFTFENITGNSPALIQALNIAKQTANMQNITLLQGESGTGKELFAQAIHNSSHYGTGPFVAINCAAIPASLLESELFGYESGAYTGAKKNGQAGKFELADGGTIFLDEINSMPLEMQVKLLRVLQEKAVSRIGGNDSISLDLKIIAASNVNLRDFVAQGLFRSDLFFRLSVITIDIPPLRERLSDIPLLVADILERKTTENLPLFPVTAEALDMLKKYSWPGNIRELENILERAYIQTTITEQHAITVDALASFAEFSSIPQEPAGRTPAYTHHGGNAFAGESQLEKQEREIIMTALQKNRWNISRTANAIGIARNTLYRKMKKYDIVIPD
jgi:transcriptional regulator with PAS, ATPase and Fis domain